ISTYDQDRYGVPHASSLPVSEGKRGGSQERSIPPIDRHWKRRSSERGEGYSHHRYWFHRFSIQVKRLGIPDIFVEHGPQTLLRENYGIDEKGIFKGVREMFEEGRPESSPS